MKWKPAFGLLVAGHTLMCETTAYLLLHRSSLIQADANAYRAVSLVPALPRRLDFPERFSFKIGEFEILEHDIDQFVQRYIGFVIIDARLIAGPSFPVGLPLRISSTTSPGETSPSPCATPAAFLP